jgi:trehalose utilization protein
MTERMTRAIRWARWGERMGEHVDETAAQILPEAEHRQVALGARLSAALATLTAAADAMLPMLWRIADAVAIVFLTYQAFAAWFAADMLTAQVLGGLAYVLLRSVR